MGGDQCGGVGGQVAPRIGYPMNRDPTGAQALIVDGRIKQRGEHGDGLVRSAYNERFFGSRLYNVFREIKLLFDPENLMNPGKIVNAQTIEQNLRYGTKYEDKDVKTAFQYRVENSFRESVHMCTGVGECRKLQGGTMCPAGSTGTYKVVISKVGIHFTKVNDDCADRSKIDGQTWFRVR